MASTDNVIGNQLLVAPSSTARALFLTIAVITIEMRMASTAARQVLPARLAEGVRHVARCGTLVAFDPEVFGL